MNIQRENADKRKRKNKRIQKFVVKKLEGMRSKKKMSRSEFSRFLGWKGNQYCHFVAGIRHPGIFTIIQFYKRFNWNLNELKQFA